MKPLTEYSNAEEWATDAKKEGYDVGNLIVRGISETMAKNNMTFAEAYEYLMGSKMLFQVGKIFAIHVSMVHK